MPGKHASKSPSSSHRWGGYEACTASITAQSGQPDNAIAITRTGSTGHQIVDECLRAHLRNEDREPEEYLGRVMCFFDDHRMAWRDDVTSTDGLEHTVAVDETLVGYCERHIAFVLERQRVTGGELFVEDRVPIDHITGEEDAEGSTDTALVYGRTCEVIDLKLGGREVKAYEVIVPAHEDLITGEVIAEVVEPNSQIGMYGSGTMRKLEAFYDFDEVVLIISQPSIGKVSQWSGSVDELNVMIERLKRRSWECDNEPKFVASSSNCLYCKAGGDCQAQTDKVMETIKPFDDMHLGSRYEMIPLLREFISATERRMQNALSSGQAVFNSQGIAFKRVEGKAAAREWDDEAAVLEVIEKMRLKKEQTHTEPKLKSPTQLSELWTEKKNRKGVVTREAVIGPTQAKRIQEHIHQGKNAPQIVLATDPRPPLAAASDGFEEVFDDGDMPNADLF